MPMPDRDSLKHPDVQDGAGDAGMQHSASASEEGTLAYRLITSVLLFGLLAEWLLPWVNAGEWSFIYHPSPLLAVIGFIMAAGLFRMPFTLTLVMNVLLCLLTLMWLYKSSDQSGLQWLMEFPTLLENQIQLIMQNGLWAMSGELRTLLLFGGWAMLVPALQSLMWLRQIALGVAALTAAYLIALHAWLGMDVMDGLLRTTAEGLLLGAVVAVPRVRRVVESGMGKMKGLDFRWLAGSVFLIVTIVGCALLFAAGRDSSMAPANWTASVTDRVQRAIVDWDSQQRLVATRSHLELDQLGRGFTGYSFDDSELGGSISEDQRVIFKGISPVKGYWRGEAKSIYTGRGWSNERSRVTLLPVQSEEAAPGVASAEDSGVTNTSAALLGLGPTVKQTVIWEEPTAGMPIFASGPSGRVTDLIAADPRRKLGSYLKNEFSGSLYPAADTVKVERYTVESVLPVTDEAELRELGSYSITRLPEDSGAAEGDNAKLTAAELKPYLQLPESLPDRVVALAAEVAGGGITNRYDQVKAIEDFLKNNYAYSMQKSKLPPSGADFVDDFLFEQRLGYCVHFSTAMVVMLRSQEIPARWVKGFTSGTLIETGHAAESADRVQQPSSRMQTYEVRASNAHAWVEVYFPGVGWVPFDPTPGFAGVAAVASTAVGGGDVSASAGEADANLGGGASAASLAKLGAAAQQAATAVVRGADALAHAARGAAGAAAATPVASAAIAGAAAIALAAVVVAAAQRKRLRLALALHRYSAAYERSSAAHAQAYANERTTTSGSQASMPRIQHNAFVIHEADDAARILPPRKSSMHRGMPAAVLMHEDEQLRVCCIVAIQLLMEQVCRRVLPTMPKEAVSEQGRIYTNATIRERVHSLQRYLTEEQKEGLQRLVACVEEACFNKEPYAPIAPIPEELLSVSRVLLRRKKSLPRQLAASK